MSNVNPLTVIEQIKEICELKTMRKNESETSDKELKRVEQVINAALEAYPDNAAKYSAFIAGAIWSDNQPKSDNEWHKVGDGVDPTEGYEDGSNVIMHIDGDRDIYVTSIDTIKDVYHTFYNFVGMNDVRYWAYARGFVPIYIYDELFREAMGDNCDEE